VLSTLIFPSEQIFWKLFFEKVIQRWYWEALISKWKIAMCYKVVPGAGIEPARKHVPRDFKFLKVSIR